MSHHHHGPVEDNVESHPVKLAVAVIVGAVGLVVGIIMLAYFAIGTHRVGENHGNSPENIVKNVAPLVTLAVDASKGPVPALTQAVAVAAPKTAADAPIVAAAIPAALPAGAAAAAPSGGEGVYKASCSACHAAGIAGAPKAGDKAQWGPRAAKGKATLYEHALKGFNAMPAKGGNGALADADVKAAVDYLLAQVK